MKNDSLNDVITSIVEWCNINGISIFYSDVDEEDAEVTWNRKTEDDWKKYLEVQKNSNSKILILSIVKNNVDDYIDDVKELNERLKGEELQEFANALEIVMERKGQVASYELGFYYNGRYYKYSQSSAWENDYDIVMEFISNNADNAFEEAISGEASSEKIEGYVDKILENKIYLSASNQMQREDIAGHILLKEGIEQRVESLNIARKAESKFVLEIKPKQEEDRKNLILGYKRKGYNKKQTISKSGLGETIIDKYWYIED